MRCGYHTKPCLPCSSSSKRGSPAVSNRRAYQANGCCGFVGLAFVSLLSVKYHGSHQHVLIKKEQLTMRDGTRVVRAGLPRFAQGEPFLPGPTFAGPYHLTGDPTTSAYTYGRYHNPTWTHFEQALSELEG